MCGGREARSEQAIQAQFRILIPTHLHVELALPSPPRFVDPQKIEHWHVVFADLASQRCSLHSQTYYLFGLK